ncbi:MAG: carcinine hydrolase/isopenicillin-N N-acyltransferase family protein [Defluviitaleaceae bacterium]|nr:carcinine hydrolase/isopenicillin-N N-acyltransferase family protein [Defluviitaleaceae bacterium]
MENFKNAIQSLTTLKKIDDYGMFQMTYVGDYGFDEFLKVGFTDTEDDFTFMMKHLLKGIDDSPTSGVSKAPGGGCTTFTTRNDKGEFLLCRNYDFAPVPSLQLFTKPDKGYASVSTVNLLYNGYSILPNPLTDTPQLPSGLNLESFATLNTPYMPMDGMNAKGVAIAAVFVPQAEPPHDPSKTKINQLNAMRLVLDKATSVAEAINLLGQHNIFFEVGAFVQYHIADASGRSVIVGFAGGEIVVTEVPEAYQVCANFAAYNPEICAGVCEFERYDKAKTKLEAHNGILTDAQAIDLMAEIGAFNEGQFDLQWSVMYNLTTLEGVIFANRKKDDLNHFNLEGKI